jgi:hypothetical protein
MNQPTQLPSKGEATSEWKALLFSSLANLLIGVFGGVLGQWGINIDPELLVAAIIGNTVTTASYTGGRSYLKARVAVPPNG